MEMHAHAICRLRLACRFVFELALPCKMSDPRPLFTGVSREPAAAVPPQEQVRVPATPHNVRGRGSMLSLGVDRDPHSVRGRLDHYRAPPVRA
jgi:hypothetical protein